MTSPCISHSQLELIPLIPTFTSHIAVKHLEEFVLVFSLHRYSYRKEKTPAYVCTIHRRVFPTQYNQPPTASSNTPRTSDKRSHIDAKNYPKPQTPAADSQEAKTETTKEKSRIYAVLCVLLICSPAKADPPNANANALPQ
jgi:FtsZ-interacting cell division protein ZipA